MDIPFFKSLSFAKGSSLFKKKETSVLGIDLGSSSLKVVQLKRDNERAILETYGELACGRYAGAAVWQSVKLVDQKVVEMLTDILKEANITSRRAAVSVPLRNSFVSVVSMPLMSEKELAEAVPFEARRYIPVPISEVLIDFWALPQGVSGEAGKEEGFAKEKKFMEVLLVAIHRQVVERYKSIFKEAGITVDTFEIEVFGEERSVLSREVAPILIVDLGAQATRLTIVDYGIVRLSHNVERGAQDLTNALARSLGIDFERAEKLKRDTGLSGRPEHKEIVNVIGPLLEYNFSEGLRVTAEYRRRTGHSIKKIVLTGGGALLKGLVDFSINKFGVEARLANPFSKVTYPAFLEPTLKEIGPSFSGALGLALRELQE